MILKCTAVRSGVSGNTDLLDRKPCVLFFKLRNLNPRSKAERELDVKCITKSPPNGAANVEVARVGAEAAERNYASALASLKAITMSSQRACTNELAAAGAVLARAKSLLKAARGAKKRGTVLVPLADATAGRKFKRSLSRFRLLASSDAHALYDVELCTGRTHQIRVHFADSGFPLAHDFYYNPKCFSYAAGYSYRPPPRPASAQDLELSARSPKAWLAAQRSAGTLKPWRSTARGPLLPPDPRAFMLGLQASELSFPFPAQGSPIEAHADAHVVTLRLETPQSWPLTEQ